MSCQFLVNHNHLVWSGLVDSLLQSLPLFCKVKRVLSLLLITFLAPFSLIRNPASGLSFDLSLSRPLDLSLSRPLSTSLSTSLDLSRPLSLDLSRPLSLALSEHRHGHPLPFGLPRGCASDCPGEARWSSAARELANQPVCPHRIHPALDSNSSNSSSNSNSNSSSGRTSTALNPTQTPKAKPPTAHSPYTA